MASFPNQSEMPSFYWDNVNTAEITNCSPMLGCLRISWKLRIEPKKASNSKTRWQVRESYSPCPSPPPGPWSTGGCRGKGQKSCKESARGPQMLLISMLL